jgi:transketolase
MRPVLYTITPFLTTRCLEQIRVDLCYQNLPVTLVGVGGGLSYAELGATHHSCEDIGLLRMLPGMVVECPGDAVEVRLGLRAALQQDQPMYLRLGKRGEPVVHAEPPPFAIGKSIQIRGGSEVCLLSTGNLLPIAVDAAAELDAAGISTRVESFHTVKPLDERLLSEVFDAYSLVVTIEEHSVLGGLGGSVAEWLADRPTSPKGRLLRIGTPDVFFHESGEQEHAREYFGFTPGGIASRVIQRHANLIDARTGR